MGITMIPNTANITNAREIVNFCSSVVAHHVQTSPF
jgi:hypothetical protein